MGKSRTHKPLRFLTINGLMFVSDDVHLRSYDRNGKIKHLLTLDKKVGKSTVQVFVSLLKEHPRLINLFPDWLKGNREVKSVSLIQQMCSPPSSVG